MSIEIYDDEIALANKVAYTVGRKWKTIEIEDLKQHLILWLYENYTAVERWRKETGDGKLYVSLRREAGKYCGKETSANVGQNIEKDNEYNVEMVKKILPFIWEITEHQAGNLVGESPLAIAVLTDVSSAYHGMKKEDKELLALRFRDGKSYAVLGQYLEVSADAARMRLNRTLERLTDKLAGEPIQWINKKHNRNIPF